VIRSKPFKEFESVRLRIIEQRIHQPLRHQPKPRPIARWCRVGIHWALLQGHASQHVTLGGRRFRLVLRLKRHVATWFGRREL